MLKQHSLALWTRYTHSLTQVCAIPHVVGQGSVFNNTNTHRLSGTLVKWNKSQKLVATLLDRLRLKLAVFVYRCWASQGRGPKPQPSDTQVESVMKHWSLRPDRVTIDRRYNSFICSGFPVCGFCLLECLCGVSSFSSSVFFLFLIQYASFCSDCLQAHLEAL